MLLRFRVTNFASLLAEQEISLVATDPHDELATSRIPGLAEYVLPAAAIVGANASGKSNVVHALSFMRQVVLDSHRRWLPDNGVPRRPFLLSKVGRSSPSAFAVDLVLDGVRHEYGFEVDDRRVLEEWLYSYPEGRRRVLFERRADGDVSSYRYGTTFKGHKKVIEDVVRPNSLFLSAGASNNHPVLSRLQHWFHRTLRIATNGNFASRLDETLDLWARGERTQVQLRALLRYADLGIMDLAITEEKLDAARSQRIAQLLRELDPEHFGDPAELETASASVRRLHLLHGTRDAPVPLDLEYESSGTRTWAGLLGPVVNALTGGRALVVDELDARLHPLLAARLVALFQNRSTNPSGAQLLFNTHDATLLAPHSEARLHRDQIWLTEKDAQGATTILPLIDYRVRDGLENVEKRYLAGRYGALPFFDDQLLERLGDRMEEDPPVGVTA